MVLMTVTYIIQSKHFRQFIKIRLIRNTNHTIDYNICPTYRKSDLSNHIYPINLTGNLNKSKQLNMSNSSINMTYS